MRDFGFLYDQVECAFGKAFAARVVDYFEWKPLKQRVHDLVVAHYVQRGAPVLTEIYLTADDVAELEAGGPEQFGTELAKEVAAVGYRHPLWMGFKIASRMAAFTQLK